VDGLYTKRLCVQICIAMLRKVRTQNDLLKTRLYRERPTLTHDTCREGRLSEDAQAPRTSQTCPQTKCSAIKAVIPRKLQSSRVCPKIFSRGERHKLCWITEWGHLSLPMLLLKNEETANQILPGSTRRYPFSQLRRAQRISMGNRPAIRVARGFN
jgi:hypothetical protein